MTPAEKTRKKPIKAIADFTQTPVFDMYVWLRDFSSQKGADMLQQFETLTIDIYPYLFKRIKEQVLHLN